MKKCFTLVTVLFGILPLFVSGQSGCPDCLTSLPEELPENAFYLDPIPEGKVGVYYEEDISFRFPKTTDPVALLDPNVLPGLPIAEITILSVSNLPPGISWEASDVVFNTADKTDGCIRLCGYPLEADSFTVDIELEANLTLLKRTVIYDVEMNIAPQLSETEGFTIIGPQGCGEVVASFENNIPSKGKEGYSYQWSFGNGNSSTLESPPAQSYTVPGLYPVDYTATIDTVGFILTKVTVNSVSCSDLFGGPDLYLRIEDENKNVVYEVPHTDNVGLPFSFTPNIKLQPSNYTLLVRDEDAGLDGSDDTCASLEVNINSNGNFSSSEWDLDLEVIHPVIMVVSSDTIEVFEMPAVPQVDKRGPSRFCLGDSLMLSSSYEMGNQWMKNGSAIAGATESVFYAKETGAYQVFYTSPDGCVATSNPEEVFVNDPPPAPVFSNTNNDLSLDEALNLPANYSLQWYFNDEPVPDGTEAGLCSTQSGSYTLFLLDEDTGCSSSFTQDITNDANFDCTVPVAEVDEQAVQLKVYPNPVVEALNLTFYLKNAADVKVQLFDLLGRKHWEREYPDVIGQASYQYDMSSLPGGLYLLEIRMGDTGTVKKIMRPN